MSMVDIADDGRCGYAVSTDDNPILLNFSSEFSIYEQHHRLCNQSDPDHFKSRMFSLHIHSLLGMSDSLFIVSRLRLLRVLKFSDTQGYIGTLEFLFQLRYLEIPYLSLQMSERFENLEFLFVTGPTATDPLFSNLPKLRHLYLKTPSRISKDWKIPQTNSLETLSGVLVDNLNDEKILRCFPHLHHLKCDYGKYWNECPDLSFLTQLESLKMTFYGWKVKFTEIKFPTNIKKLSLSNFPCQRMSSVGKLPNLEILKLQFLNFEGENWNTNDDEFQKLKYLKLRYLKFEDWNTSEDHFPTLERLVLEGCDYFQSIPSELGYIPTLQMIEVHSCGVIVTESAMKIKEEQKENGNEELTVIINGLK
ncbi:NB-ARC domain-containing protein [Abeliophyllum distichum]|uniref:NB-ARC domain-containing protein n=1 Tax=Abeliophyllum distichum TaxID=126358 RepID=A0ABD1SWL0_9LAMI